MYFPIGWPKYYSPKDVECGELSALKYNRDRSLLAVISAHSVCVWNNRPRVLIVTIRRSPSSLKEVGTNVAVVWKPDSSVIAVSTSEGKIVLLELQRSSGQQLYKSQFLSSSNYYQSPYQNGVPAIKLVEISIITIAGDVTCFAPRKDELFVCSGKGFLHRITWDGYLEANYSMPVCSIPFTNDVQNIRAVPLELEGVCFRAMEYSPLLGGFAVVLADGRGGFVSAETSNFEPSEIIGVWARDLDSATCVAINHRYRLIVFGCTNGASRVYGFDDTTGALELSHTLVLSSKDYPDAIQSTGGVQCLAWTPDGCALAVSWSWTSHGGLAVWSVFGSLLMCTLGGDYGKSQEAFLHNPFHVKSMGWGPEGYNLVMVSSEEDNGCTGDIMQLQFVKSTLAVNPCMSNHRHLFLQSEDSLYLNTGEMVSDSTNNFANTGKNGTTPLIGPSDDNGMQPLIGSSVGPSTLVSNKQWIIIQIPINYLENNWPIRYAAVHPTGSHLAIAGKAGIAHYALLSRKWKLFGNISQEQTIICRGGLAWWKDFIVVPCYNSHSSSDEVRFYPRASNLDNAFAVNVKLPAPAFLVNVFRDLLLVYCSDCRVVFYSMERIKTSGSDATILVNRLQEFSLANHVPHPLAVIHVTLTSQYSESGNLDGLEAVESLIANVGGWLLMLQKDKATPDKDKKSRKAPFCLPVILASCVENVWTSTTSSVNKRHLMEALWLGCGAQGMKVWLPLFPGNDQKPPNFLSKRVMLPFQLNIYPLAVLFQDAVVLGAANEPMPLDCMSPNPASLSPQPFPFCTLERTTQVYLHHVLRQLLRKNLGQQALEIANTCTDLPYFPHVLELMLHEVLEEEATASEPIPDPMLPQVVRFIQEFRQYLETVVHCARKTEVALWSYLFSAVGNPRDLFKECLCTGRLQTAASYLIILQNLEHPTISKQHATILLDKALELCQWEISKDLVRFLRCISEGEFDSPPRTPTSRPLHSPPHPTMATVDDEDMVFSFSVSPQSRGSKPSTRGTLSRGSSVDKTHLARTQSLEKSPKPISYDSTSRAKSGSVSSTDIRSSDIESAENYFIDSILNRHARLLLSANRLRDLGRFSAHVDFQLVPWLIKERHECFIGEYATRKFRTKLLPVAKWHMENISTLQSGNMTDVTSRNRAARVEGYVETLLFVHRQFDLQLPSITQPTITVLTPQSPKPAPRINRLASASSSSTRSSRQGLDDDSLADDIEEGREMEETAHLHLPRVEEIDRLSTTQSETSSLACSADEEYMWGGQDIGFIDIAEISEQLAFSGCQQALKEVRFLLQIFIEASCYDWCFLLAVILRDSNSITECINKAVTLKDVTIESLGRLNEGIKALEAWSERECIGYSLFLNLQKPLFQTLTDAVINAKAKTAERKDSKPKDSKPAVEPARRTPRTSICEEEKIIEEKDEVEDDLEKQEEESSECVLS